MLFLVVVASVGLFAVCKVYSAKKVKYVGFDTRGSKRVEALRALRPRMGIYSESETGVAIPLFYGYLGLGGFFVVEEDELVREQDRNAQGEDVFPSWQRRIVEMQQIPSSRPIVASAVGPLTLATFAARTFSRGPAKPITTVLHWWQDPITPEIYDLDKDLPLLSTNEATRLMKMEMSGDRDDWPNAPRRSAHLFITLNPAHALSVDEEMAVTREMKKHGCAHAKVIRISPTGPDLLVATPDNFGMIRAELHRMLHRISHKFGVEVITLSLSTSVPVAFAIGQALTAENAPELVCFERPLPGRDITDLPVIVSFKDTSFM